MEVKKLKSVNDFYSEVIVKDKKLTWKCPICFEECRFLDQHLKRKHSISFKDYFKSNVDYSCKYCGEFKKLSDLKWDRLKVSIHSLDHKDCIAIHKGYNIVRISNVFDGCIDYCLDSENWVKKSDLIDFDKVIESYYKGSIRKLKGKPKSSNLNDHWKFRSDITKELVDCFISDKNQKKTIRSLLNYLNVTNAKVIKRVAESFYNLTYYDFVERYLYESKIKKNN